MSDEGLRDLERRARSGDREAGRRLRVELDRRTDPVERFDRALRGHARNVDRPIPHDLVACALKQKLGPLDPTVEGAFFLPQTMVPFELIGFAILEVENNHRRCPRVRNDVCIVRKGEVAVKLRDNSRFFRFDYLPGARDWDLARAWFADTRGAVRAPVEVVEEWLKRDR